MQTLTEFRDFAAHAHEGQHDKIGAPYVEHVLAVAAGLAPFGALVQKAGLLHDVIEDTSWTVESLRDLGVPNRVVEAVWAVSKAPGDSYAAYIRRVLSNPDATLVKIADNAHNSHPDRLAHILDSETRDRLIDKYERARLDLWPAVDPETVSTIISIVNPSLLDELEKKTLLSWA